jgi:hypothetical protein
VNAWLLVGVEADSSRPTWSQSNVRVSVDAAAPAPDSCVGRPIWSYVVVVDTPPGELWVTGRPAAS